MRKKPPERPYSSAVGSATELWVDAWLSKRAFLPSTTPTWDEIDDTIELLARVDTHPIPGKARRKKVKVPRELRRARPVPVAPPCRHVFVAWGNHLPEWASCRLCGRRTRFVPKR